MASAAILESVISPAPEWYAVYVQRNHERTVASELMRREIETFLPQYFSLRTWSDRKVRSSFPLFPGYLFVHIAETERLRVLMVPRVVHLVGNRFRPIPIQNHEIHALREGARLGRVEPAPYCAEGTRVRIRKGAMLGLEGILIRSKNSARVVVQLERVMQSFAVLEIDADEIEPASGANIAI